MALDGTESGRGDYLVILHGLFGNRDNFALLSLHFDRYRTVLRLDLPGHGQSSSLPELSYARMADAVADELAGRGIKRYALLGHSLGGKVAMALAGSKRGAGIQQLIIEDIAPRKYPPHHQPFIDAMLKLDLKSIKSRNDAEIQLRDDVPDAGVRAFLIKSLYRSSPKSELFRWRFDLKGIARDYALITDVPVIENTIDCPTLFVKGGNSDYLQAGDEAAIKAAFSQPSLKTIDGTGHWLHAEKPAVFARICLEFLDKHKNTPGDTSA